MDKKLDNLANNLMGCVAKLDATEIEANDLGETNVAKEIANVSKRMATVAARVAAAADSL